MSSPFLSRVGSPITDSFIYLTQDVPRTPVTGKVQADFTMKLSHNGVGNQSISGITITEVDATNNPGEYAVAAAGTAFPAATGTFLLMIKDTASTQYRWDQEYIVTSDGTGAGTVGTASFTATVANGRITGSGGLALAGATIIIRTSLGITYATLTSDGSGLWGPVFFSSNGTYTVYVLAAGYQQASSSIIVSAGVATGPGTDIAMSASVASTSATANDLWSYARRASRNQTSPQATLEQQQATQEALEMVAKAHRWPWYLTKGQFPLYGAYTAGTGTFTNGSSTLLLTVGAIPLWVGANAKVYVGNQIINIASVADTTHLALEANWNGATQTVAFVIFQDQLLLPSDLYIFGQLLPGPTWSSAPRMIGAEQIYLAQNSVNYALRFPSVVSIIRQSLLIYPYPTTNETVSYTYWRRPATLVTGSDVADWDPAHVDLLHRAIDYQIAIRFSGFAGGTIEDAQRGWQKTLAEAAANDRSASSTPGIMSSLSNDSAIWMRTTGRTP